MAEKLSPVLQASNLDLDAILSMAEGLPRGEDFKHGMYVWKKLTAEGGDFVDYVVADTEDAYPDGGEQDGYWYELVEEGITGIDYGEVTVSSATQVTIAHNLKRVPIRAYIMLKDSGVESGQMVGNFIACGGGTIISSRKEVRIKHNGVSLSTGVASAYSDTDVTFKQSENGYNYKGTYVWLVL